MKFVPCSLQEHGAAVLDIFNDAIAHTTALYEYRLWRPERIEQWFSEKLAANYPVIGAVDDAGVLLGFSSYGAFRARPAYKYSIEHSVYVHKDHRGQGVGRALLERIIDAARQQNYHVLIGGIDANNDASIVLHRKLGFMHAGTIKEAGFKFGRWLDLAFYQLTLATPALPVDG